MALTPRSRTSIAKPLSIAPKVSHPLLIFEIACNQIDHFVTYSYVTVDTFMCVEHAHSDDHVICAALLARHGESAMASNEDGHEEL